MLSNKNKVDVLYTLQVISLPMIFVIFFWAVLFFRDNLSLMLFYLVVLVFIVAGNVLHWVQYRFWKNNIEDVISIKDGMVFVKTLTKTHQFRVKDIRFGKVGGSIWVGDTSKKISFTRLSMGNKNFNVLLTRLNSAR